MASYSYVSDDETLVNTTSAGFQGYPSITTLSDGGWVVTWQQVNYNSTSYEVYQQRYDSLGVAVGSEAILTTQSPGKEEAPVVTALADGGWVAAWSTDDGSNYRDVHLQRYSSNGVKNGGEILVNTFTTGNQGWPSVTGLSSGGWVVTWQSPNGTDSYDIYQQRYNAGGTKIGGEILVNTSTSNFQATSVVSSLPDGGWVVAWAGYDSTSFQSIFQQRYNSDGTRHGVETKVTPADGVGAAITTLNDGGWVVTWASYDGSGSGIHQQRYNADGTAHGGDQLVNIFTAGEQQDASVVALSDGGWVVVWQSADQDGDGQGIYAQVFNASGEKVGDEALINTFTAGQEVQPAVSALSDGRFVVAWSSPQDGDGGIVQAVVRPVLSSDVALDEDSSHEFTASDFDFVTTDDGTISQITVTGLPANGSLTLDGVAVSKGQVIDVEDLGGLVWTPAHDANGNDLAKFKFTAEDHSGHSTDAVFKFDVAGIPDAPVSSDQTMTIQEDTSYQFSMSSFGFSDVDGDTLQSVTITALPGSGTLQFNGVDVTVNQVISANELYNLIWKPAADANGTGLASLSFKVTDSTGTTSDAASTVTFDVTPVADYVTNGDTVVNTEHSGNQTAPSITVLADGGWVMTWTSDADSQDGNLSGVYQQRYNADGTPRGVETQVNSETEDDQNAPAVTALVDGGWVVTWQSYTQDGSGYSIYQQRYNVDGSTYGAEKRVNSTTTGDQSHPAVASLADGGWIVTWQDASTGNVNFQRYSADGSPSGNETMINQMWQSDHQQDATVTGLPDGGWVVVWSSKYADDTSEGIMLQRYNAAGNRLVAGNLGQGYGYVDDPSISSLPNGGWVVTWTAKYEDGSGDGVYLRVFKPSGLPLTPELQVNTTTMGDQSNPTATALSNGGFVVTWQSADAGSGDYEVYAQVYDSAGHAQGSEMQINTETTGVQGSPVVAALPDGTFVVAWQSEGQDGFGGTIVQTIVIDTEISTMTLNEDEPHVFSSDDFDFALGNGGSLASITVTSLPANGTLELDGAPVVKGQVIDAADIDDLVWTPAEDANGNDLANLKFKATDDNGHTANGVVKFNVTSVPDAPTSEDSPAHLNEDRTYTFSDSDFGFADRDGDTLASITITALPQNGKLMLGVNVVTLNQVIEASDFSNLTWTPDADANGDGLASLSFKVTDSSGQTSEDAHIITFNVEPIDDAPTAQDKTITLLEDGSYTFSAADFSFADADGDQFAAVVITSVPQSGLLTLDGVPVTANQEFSAVDISKLVWTPDANSNGDGLASFTFMVRDDSLGGTSGTSRRPVVDLSTEHTFTFNVTSVPDAPTGQDQPVYMDEDRTHTFSTYDFGFADGDNDTLASVTITALPQNGKLMLGDNLVTLNQVIEADDIGNLTWTPEANANGDGLASLSFKVTDSSGQTSEDSNTLTFDVDPIDDAPTSQDKTITILEDGSYTFSEADFNFADVDGDQFNSVVITSVPQSGLLTLDGVPVTANQEFSAADISKLVWTPDANDNGDGLASFTFQVRDDSDETLHNFNRRRIYDLSDEHKFTFNVTSVADAPTGKDAPVTIGEDESYTFSEADFGFADGDNDTFASITITALPQNGKLMLGDTVVTLNQVIEANEIGNLTWTPAADANGDGLGSLSFKVTDSSGQTSEHANTITFDVYPIDDAPTAQDKTITVLEDGSYTFSEADFGFADVDGNHFSAVVITSVPQSGALTLDGVPVTTNREFSAADISKLVWTPDANDNGDGLASFTFQVRDDSNGITRRASADLSAEHTFTFNVTSVEDKPTGQDAPVTIGEDQTYIFSPTDFGFADNDGDTLASVTITALPQNGELMLGDTVVTLNQVIKADDIGSLTWKPAADANGDGLGSLSFKVTDSSGQTSEHANTITFDVYPIDDAPTAQDKTITVLEDGSYTFSEADFNFADVDGNHFSAVVITSVPQSGLLTLDGVPVTTNREFSAADIAKLKWVPDANAHGDGLASFTFQVRDDSNGITRKASADLSAEHTFTFNVTSVEDKPTAQNDTITISEDGSHTFAAGDFGFADNDGDTLGSITITALPQNGTLALNGHAVTANQQIAAADLGKLVWTPAHDAHGDGLASIGFKVTDSSGLSSENAYQLDFNVTSVADAPTAADNTVGLAEDTSYSFKVADFGFADGDGDTLASVVITGLPQNGTLALEGHAVAANQEIAAADIGKLVWTPAHDANGEHLASLTFTVKDSTGASSTAHTIAFDVAGTADLPTAADRDISVAEDGSHGFVPADFGFSDVDGDSLAAVIVTGLPAAGTLTLNGQAVSENEEVAAADLGKLVWTPAENAHGDDFATLSFKVKDSSGDVSATTNKITFNVDSVADLPTASDKTVTIDEDTAYTFSADDFGFADGDGDTFDFITVTGLSGSGSLTLDGEAVAANQTIAASDLSHLVWAAAANANGEAIGAFTFTVTDSSGETSAAEHTIDFDVNAVNDGPQAIDDKAALTEGKSVRVAVLKNDHDVDGDKLSVSAATVTSHNGKVSIDDDGRLTVSYTGKNLSAGATAEITVNYTAFDGTLSDDATLTVTVTGVSERGPDITGTPKADRLIGTGAGERIVALGSDDVIKGRGGSDNISAGAGNDRIDGGAGNDKIGGGGGDDIIKGGAGNDKIMGWGGNDKLTGGDGADTFMFHRKDGNDTITDFQTKGSDHDMIDVTQFDSIDTFKQLKAMMSQHGHDVVIELPNKTTITLEHTDLADLSKDHFMF